MPFAVCVLGMLLLGGSPAGMGEDCSGVNEITAMTSGMASFQAVSPLDFSMIRSSGALSSRNGTRIKVCLSNADFTIQQMSNDYVLPISNREQFIAVITFSNGSDAVVPGEYSPAAGYGKPLWVYAEVKLHKADKGVIVSLGVQEGKAVIQELTGERICGEFDLRTKPGNPIPSEISGRFDVRLESSR